MPSRQFFVFILIGIACALIDVGLMQFLIWMGINYLIATTAGFLSGLTLNFLLHTRITFDSDYSREVFFRFMVVVLVNYFLTLLTVSFFHVLLNMALLGKFISLPMVAFNGFFLSKKWVYR